MDEVVELTPENLKALAHPLRIKVLGLLRMHGPSTATTLAERLGLTSGALSYHLRQLERYGFIVEDAERGNRRDRWWRAGARTTHYDRQIQAEAGELFEEVLVGTVIDGLNRGRAAVPELPEPWQRIFEISDYALRLDPAEATALSDDLNRLLGAYRQHDPTVFAPPDTRVVRAQFQLFVLPEES